MSRGCRSSSPPACSPRWPRCATRRWRGARRRRSCLGVVVWVAVRASGVDPVISGLAVGLVTAAYPPARADFEEVTRLARSFREQPTPALARSAPLGVASAISPNERLQYRLHPWTSFVMVPLFALANVGIHIGGHLIGEAIASPITLGIVAAYEGAYDLDTLTAAVCAGTHARGRRAAARAGPS